VIDLADHGKVFLGTSGWSYKDWIGPFYMKKDKSMLRAYTKVFKTVEINSTFYRYPSKGTVMGWTRYSPEGFVYSAKLPRLITHDKLLKLNEGVEEDLQKFVEVMEPLILNGKLGCILIQLPPKLECNLDDLEDFLKILPTHIKFAIEFRNLSWMRQETWKILKEYRISYTIVDEPLLPSEIHVTSNIAYFRWHGHGSRPWYNYRYHAEQLEPWIPKIEKAASKVKKMYGYFNNHYHGYAVENCLQIMEMLGVLTPEQLKAKNRIENYFDKSKKAKEYTLEEFIEPKKKTDLDDLLRYHIDDKRLTRAKQIKDDELRVRKRTDESIEATIRDYHIVIDLETRTISHDCPDWSKLLPVKKLCKHIGKLLLSLEKEKAKKILNDMSTQKEKWKFRSYK